MGLFEFIGTTLNALASPIVKAGQAADESLTVATTVIHNRAVSTKLTDRQLIIDRTTETLKPIQEKLDTDEEYAAIYRSVEAEFAKYD